MLLRLEMNDGNIQLCMMLKWMSGVCFYGRKWMAVIFGSYDVILITSSLWNFSCPIGPPKCNFFESLVARNQFLVAPSPRATASVEPCYSHDSITIVGLLVDLNEFPSLQYFKKCSIHTLESRHQKTTSNLLRINLKGILQFNETWPLEGAMYIIMITLW